MEFRFYDEWYVAAEPDRAWTEARDLASWPEWWPVVRRTQNLGSSGAAERWAFTFRTRLPYSMVFTTELRVHPAERRVDAAVDGRVRGEGQFTVTGIEGGAAVRFDWVVTPQVRWMRLVAPVARPVFRWNHRALMEEGGEAFARRLGTRLLKPTVSELN